MITSISNVETQNLIFFILLGLAIILAIRKKTDKTIMSIDTTNELKGLAILAVVFVHVGFFSTTSRDFLFPLSTWSGVAVNLFFFLSAFGLTLSALKKDLTIGQFYLRRLSRVIIPVWIFLVVFLLLDKFALGISYPLGTTIRNFLGYFPRADLYNDINSPLWFITPMVFYYLLFPILFRKKIPELTAMAFFIIGYYLVNYFIPTEVDYGVKSFWQLHYWTFPVGIVFASILNRLNTYQIIEKIKQIKYIAWIKYFILIILVLAWCYFFKNSGVGQDKFTEQLYSILAMLITVFIFILKPCQNKFLNWLGLYSFEIYLLHWPIMWRYDFLFRFLPAGLAMFLYILIFIGLGWLIKNLPQKLKVNKN